LGSYGCARLFSLIALLLIARATSEANAKAEIVQKEIRELSQQEQSILKEAEQVQSLLTRISCNL